MTIKRKMKKQTANKLLCLLLAVLLLAAAPIPICEGAKVVRR